MKAIDELRAFAADPLLGVVYKGQHAEAINAIADAIEAEQADMQAFCDRLQKAASEHADVTLWGTDYTALPVDADGVPIHIGDSVEIIGGEYGAVVAIELCEDGGWNVSMRPTGWDTPTLFAAETVRHHRPPTVEDVLMEFALACEDAGNAGPEVARIAAEYAARLRLAGEAE